MNYLTGTVPLDETTLAFTKILLDTDAAHTDKLNNILSSYRNLPSEPNTADELTADISATKIFMDCVKECQQQWLVINEYWVYIELRRLESGPEIQEQRWQRHCIQSILEQMSIFKNEVDRIHSCLCSRLVNRHSKLMSIVQQEQSPNSQWYQNSIFFWMKSSWLIKYAIDSI